MIKFIAAFFGSALPLNTSTITSNCFKTEHPSLAAKRDEAKAKMKEWGRKTMLEGGDFSFARNHVLKREATLTS